MNLFPRARNVYVVRNDPDFGLDIPGDDDDSESVPTDGEEPAQAPAIVHDVQPVAAGATSARSREIARSRDRHFWQGNDTKLNFVARHFLLQPQRQEMLAIASNQPERVAEIRQLKRVQTRDFGHDNYKHAAFSFLVQKTCEELNSNQAFVEGYLPANSLLNAELLRQKIKEFQQIAVRANIQDIDSRNYHLLCSQLKCVQLTCLLQNENSGNSI